MPRHYAMLRHGFSLGSAVHEIMEKFDELANEATGHEFEDNDVTCGMAFALMNACMNYMHAAMNTPDKRDQSMMREYRRIRLEAQSAHLKKED